MKTNKNTEIEQTVIEKLCRFVDSRSGLDWRNYGDAKSYRAEQREITADRSDFYELLNLAFRRVDNFSDKVTAALTNGNRLTLKNGELDYCTGQYYPVEYRPAACRVLADILWNDYREERGADGAPIYATGDDIRKAIRRNVSRRVMRGYFN